MVNRSPIMDFGFYTSVLQEVMKSLWLCYYNNLPTITRTIKIIAMASPCYVEKVYRTQQYSVIA